MTEERDTPKSLQHHASRRMLLGAGSAASVFAALDAADAKEAVNIRQEIRRRPRAFDLREWGGDPSGVGDSTSALQSIIQHCYGNNISGRIVCYGKFRFDPPDFALTSLTSGLGAPYTPTFKINKNPIIMEVDGELHPSGTLFLGGFVTIKGVGWCKDQPQFFRSNNACKIVGPGGTDTVVRLGHAGNQLIDVVRICDRRVFF